MIWPTHVRFPPTVAPRSTTSTRRSFMLAERFRCTKAVGVLKAAHGLQPADPAREQRQITRLRQLAKDAHFDPDFAEKFLNFVVREVIRHHEQIAASNGMAKIG